MSLTLGVDPSLRGTGYGVLRSEQGQLSAIDYGVIHNPARLDQAACLCAIFDRLSEVLALFPIDSMAIESSIYVQSYKTAIVLGQARGVAVLAAARRGIPIFEYAPRRAKQAVVGRGGAGKDQVAFMVRALLGLQETPPSDAADALAMAITHIQSSELKR